MKNFKLIAMLVLLSTMMLSCTQDDVTPTDEPIEFRSVVIAIKTLQIAATSISAAEVVEIYVDGNTIALNYTLVASSTLVGTESELAEAKQQAVFLEIDQCPDTQIYLDYTRGETDALSIWACFSNLKSAALITGYKLNWTTSTGNHSQVFSYGNEGTCFSGGTTDTSCQTIPD